MPAPGWARSFFCGIFESQTRLLVSPGRRFPDASGRADVVKDVEVISRRTGELWRAPWKYKPMIMVCVEDRRGQQRQSGGCEALLQETQAEAL